MMADMETNKKLSPIVTKLFLRGRKLNNSIAFIAQSYLKVPKTIRLNATYHFVMKIPTKREHQHTAYSSDIEFKDFMNC